MTFYLYQQVIRNTTCFLHYFENCAHLIFCVLNSTGDVPRDFFSGTNLPGETLPPGSGQIYAVTGLNARGVRERPVCSKTVCNLIQCANQ